MLNTIFSIAVKLVPEKYKPSTGMLQMRLNGLIHYRGNKVTCPCCGESYREFMPFGVEPLYNVLCPNCFSLERHRLLWLYFKNKTNIFNDRLKVLHVAPEEVFQKQFKAMANLDYTSIDLNSPIADLSMDITRLEFQDNIFDVIICNHVLEHIVDDKKAMTELLRVLKPGGWAVLQVPINGKLMNTYEDFSITSPEEKEKAFGQDDHVRVYGLDYVSRLESAGFKVKKDAYIEELGPELIKKYALDKWEYIYLCTK
jgi:predicted SAM-dependent methyltransferase